MKTYFITGGEGFIGYHLCKELLKDNTIDKIVIYDAFKHYIPMVETTWLHYQAYRIKTLNDKRIVRVRGDTTDRGLLKENIEKYKPNIIIHLAALPIAFISDVYPEEAKRNILDGAITLLDVIREASFKLDRLVYISSSMVYGDFLRDKDDKIIPAKEDQACNPMDLYGSMKLSGEYITKAYCKKFGIKYTILRPSAVYGPTDCNRRVTEIFLYDAMKGKEIILDNGGYHQLDFTYVEDLAKGIMLAATSDKAVNQIFNITRGEGRTIHDLAQILLKLIPSAKIIEQSRTVNRPNRGTCDITKAKELLGYNPKFSLEDGMKIYYEFVKEQGVLV